MDSYYQSHMDGLAIKLHKMLVADGVMKFFRDVYYGNNEERKKAFEQMLFLADPKFDNPAGWIDKAIDDFDSKDVFDDFRNDLAVNDAMKCMFVKAYRVLVKEKRKQKLEPTVTSQEVLDRVISWFGHS